MKSFFLIILLLSASFGQGTTYAESGATTIGPVEIVPPSGFSVAEKFQGLLNEEQESSIMIVEIPAAFSDAGPKILGGFREPKRLVAQHLTLIGEETWPRAEGDAYVLKLKQQYQGVTFAIFMLLLGDASRTVQVVGKFPSQEPSLEADPRSSIIMNALRSIRLVSVGSTGRPEFIYELEPIEPFKLAHKMPPAIVYNLSGKIPDKHSQKFIFSSSFRGIPERDHGAFAERRFNEFPDTKLLRVRSKEKVTIAGLPGYELVADVTDTDQNVQLTGYEIVLYGKDVYFLGIGLMPPDKEDTFIPILKRMSRTFKRR